MKTTAKKTLKGAGLALTLIALTITLATGQAAGYRPTTTRATAQKGA